MWLSASVETHGSRKIDSRLELTCEISLGLEFSFSGGNDVELGLCLEPVKNLEAPGGVIQNFVLL